MQIIPAILEKSLKDIKTQISILGGEAKCVQIDFCDGVFVHSKTWPYGNGGFASDIDAKHIIESEEGLPFIEDIEFEADLMIANPINEISSVLALGPTRIIIHLDSLKDINDILKIKEKIPGGFVELGVALSHKDDLNILNEIIEYIDFVQHMGIDHIGVQGEVFDMNTVERVKEIKSMFPDLQVSVDGGVNMKNIESLKLAGVDSLVIGSAIFHTKDPLQSFFDFKDII